MPTATTNVDQPMSTDAHQAALNSDTLPKDGRTADTLDLQRSQPTYRPHRPTTEASTTRHSDGSTSGDLQPPNGWHQRTDPCRPTTRKLGGIPGISHPSDSNEAAN